MNHLKPAVCISALLLATSAIAKSQETKEKQEAPAPRSKNGKKLFGTAEALRVQLVRVGGAWRIHDIDYGGREGSLRGMFKASGSAT